MKAQTKSLQNYQKSLRALLQRVIILGAAGNHDEAKMSNAELWIIHEFGVPPHIPERAPIRKSFDKDKGAALMQFFQKLIEANTKENGSLDIHAITDALGDRLVAMVKATVDRGLTPPLSENYLEKKLAAGYSSLPLVRTGQLLESLVYEIKK